MRTRRLERWRHGSKRRSVWTEPMTAANSASVAPLVEHFFRNEAGRLVAVLTRIFGLRNFDLVEDMVQATLVDALTRLAESGPGESVRMGSSGCQE